MKQSSRSNDTHQNKHGRRAPSPTALLMLTTLTSLIAPTHQLSLSTVISALPTASWSLRKAEATAAAPTTATSTIANTIVKLSVPSLLLSMADDRSINGIYTAQDPKCIPSGFVRACSKAGGFAPRPLWDELTNGITPWFESKDSGCFIYFNCMDGRWWVDGWDGNPLFLAVPDGSLLLPPMDGWVSLTGRRAGAPRMSYL